ncbi:fimbrial biogenesis chaperone [Deinococcus aquaedulcis]|uniref:molecular chaperone n=1 Tax=Deinococcus aquaedulcis TaxID=2840455 RepID=UPI001C82FC95|nr:molecular chaperone [Deinococcus aquaedulcis]
MPTLRLPVTFLTHLARRCAALPRPLLLAAALLGAASAQTFGFTPTTLDIDATKNLVAETTMVNSTNAAARFTVTAKVWKVVGGNVVLEDTRDLIVNPATFTVKPGESQLIRVGVRKKPSGTELSYRILVQQEAIEGVALPKVNTGFGDGRTAGLNVNVSFSLPIYVTAPGAKPQVTFQATERGKDLILNVQNAGNRRQIYRNVVVTRGSVSQSTQMIAALAGSTLTFTLPGLAEQRGPLTLKYLSEDGRTLVETIAVP